MIPLMLSMVLGFAEFEFNQLSLQYNWCRTDVASDRELALRDLLRFPTLSQEECGINMKLIDKEFQRADEVRGRYGWFVHALWYEDCTRRLAIWRIYKWASDKTSSRYCRLLHLYDLRSLLGDEEFFQGKLPPLVSGLP